jgi:hypothetical protein
VRHLRLAAAAPPRLDCDLITAFCKTKEIVQVSAPPDLRQTVMEEDDHVELLFNRSTSHSMCPGSGLAVLR